MRFDSLNLRSICLTLPSSSLTLRSVGLTLRFSTSTLLCSGGLSLFSFLHSFCGWIFFHFFSVSIFDNLDVFVCLVFVVVVYYFIQRTVNVLWEKSTRTL